jgi:hypothetical protein
VKRVLAALCFILYGGPVATPECAAPQLPPLEQRLSQVAIQAIRNADSVWARDPLRATRVAQLEDDLYYVLCPDPLVLPTRISPVAFYRIDIPGYVIKDDMAVSASVQLPGPRRWLVAIDIKSEEVFLLDGSRDPLAGFNALMRKARVNVGDDSVAEQVFFLYLEAVRGGGYLDALPMNALELESLVMRYFARRSEPAAKEHFQEWWGRVPASVKARVAPPTAAKGRAGFDIRYYWFKSGVLSEYSVAVGADGTVTELTAKLVARTR